MSFSRCLHLAAAIAAVALVTPRAASAQTWVHSWTLCTPSDSFHSCHSVSIETDPVLNSANVRTGTTISIALHNLQGQGYAADNTTSSGLYKAFFIAPTLPLGHYASTSVPVVASGGAIGTPTWYGNADASGGYGYATVYGYGSSAYNVLGGCGSIPLYDGVVYDGQTCVGPNPSFTFSFTLIGDIVNANQFAAADIVAYGVGGYSECFSDPSQYPFAPVLACDVRSESVSVTPEPATLVLLGSGLLGIGGVGLRRRKRTLG